MSIQLNTNSPDNLKKLHHDLGGVLGNLMAFERVMFSKTGLVPSENHKTIYEGLLKNFEDCLTRLSQLNAHADAEKESARGETSEVSSWK